MMQILVDGRIAYDSRLKQPGADYALEGLKTVKALNKGGTAEIIMPAGHPAYNFYAPLLSIVEIFKDGKLHFRGRPLPPRDDMQRRRTVTCEGELCFFLDGVLRPYVLTGTPEEVFRFIVDTYNSQAIPAHRFTIGDITVKDPNDYIRFESENAEQCLDALNRLIERCGGYIMFTADVAGGRAINWLDELPYSSTQEIRFGSNLIDYAKESNVTDLATAILPYGAKDEESGLRIGIASVTDDSADYIADPEAVSRYGLIIRPVVFDDVTTPEILLRKAEQWLAARTKLITSIKLTSVDLHRIDPDIGPIDVGDRVHAVSPPHGIDDWYLTIERTEDHLDAANSNVVLGCEMRTLTGSTTAADRAVAKSLSQTAQSVKVDAQISANGSVQASERRLSSTIAASTNNILLRIEDTTTAVQGLQSRMTALELDADGVSLSIGDLRQEVDAKADKTVVEDLREHFRFGEDGMTIFNAGTGMGIGVSEERVSFSGGSQSPTTEIFPTSMKTTNLRVGERLDLGNYSLIPRSNGNLSLRWTGG